ncbi:MAG: hypothetical protein INQ03_21945 [Candidatus Heimdallarchaeota archaeon]|nr:hypothetical protein [Candidatus Heimdallarchaeota archaeon]
MKHNLSPIKYQLNINSDEKQMWSDFAREHFRGNMARMIRTLVNHGINNGYVENSGIPEEMTSVIESIENQTASTGERIGSFQSDLTIIKTLLSKLLENQSNSYMAYQTSMKPSLEELVRRVIFNYVDTQQRLVDIEEMYSYLQTSSDEVRQFLYTENSKLPGGAKIAISLMLEEAVRELGFKNSQEVNIYDF